METGPISTNSVMVFLWLEPKLKALSSGMSEICASVQAQNGGYSLQSGHSMFDIRVRGLIFVSFYSRFIVLRSAAPEILQNSAILDSVPRHTTEIGIV